MRSQRDITDNLGLEPEHDSTSEFTAHEFALLKQLRSEQLASREIRWESCYFVASVLYNSAVRQLDNPSLDIRKHSYYAIARRLGPIDHQLEQLRKTQQSSTTRIMILERKQVNDEENSVDDSTLQKKLAIGIKNVKQVYRSVYDFAACVCPGIQRKSEEYLERRWDSLRRAQSYNRKIKAGANQNLLNIQITLYQIRNVLESN
ncbi:hypothetical protein PHMEG_0008976 [Phytophthora megakarya]|uniref:Uncharacterized protein n=1 Tax=Phytophthora megakarya TaxID=4795 RepID=A0A225WHA8_9STRA|nr:hypothetical protein PHMEG_0008976 [Phytophthora megakarya]